MTNHSQFLYQSFCRLCRDISAVNIQKLIIFLRTIFRAILATQKKNCNPWKIVTTNSIRIIMRLFANTEFWARNAPSSSLHNICARSRLHHADEWALIRIENSRRCNWQPPRLHNCEAALCPLICPVIRRAWRR